MADDPRDRMRRLSPVPHDLAVAKMAPNRNGRYVDIDDPSIVALVAERDALREYYEAAMNFLYGRTFDVPTFQEEAERYAAARARVEAIKPQEEAR